jgi:glycosyltransferase involved in cell wall biosynthesis
MMNPTDLAPPVDLAPPDDATPSARCVRVSIVTATFNEQDNVEELSRRIRDVMSQLPRYDYEHIFIDNASTDATVERVKHLIESDERIRLIVNVRNFGQVRSPTYGVLQAEGDVVVSLASDLQDPPELIPRFLQQWEQGFKVVAGVKARVEEGFLIGAARSAYYQLLRRISDVEVIAGFTGFGLYDRCVVRELRRLNDAYPYLRGLVSELGYAVARIPFDKPARRRGMSSNGLLSLYDMAMLGITSHSRAPLRVATMTGFGFSLLSAFVAFGYLVAKLLFWERIPFGFAPLLIGVFFLGSLQLFFIGVVGEYLGAVHLNVLKRPLVVEKERVNWPKESPRLDRGPTDP